MGRAPTLAEMGRANVKVTLEYKRPVNGYEARKAGEEGVTAQLNFSL